MREAASDHENKYMHRNEVDEEHVASPGRHLQQEEMGHNYAMNLL